MLVAGSLQVLTLEQNMLSVSLPGWLLSSILLPFNCVLELNNNLFNGERGSFATSCARRPGCCNSWGTLLLHGKCTGAACMLS